MIIEIQPLSEAKLPEYATEGSSGFDLTVHSFQKLYEVGNKETSIQKMETVIRLRPSTRVLVGCGFKIAIPKGYEMQIRPRSGIALKEGITVLNSPGTIDSDYRGEVKVILINHSSDEVIITIGDKIAQGVIQEIYRATWRPVTEIDQTKRGEGGFGSTDQKQIPDNINRY